MVLRITILSLCLAFAASSAQAQQEKVVSGKVGSNSAYAETFDTEISDLRLLLQGESARLTDLLARLAVLEQENDALKHCNANDQLLDSFVSFTDLDLNCRDVVVDPCETCNPE